MGGKSEIILPLIMIGALATGPAGLALWGTGVSSAGASLATQAGLKGLGAAGEFALASAAPAAETSLFSSLASNFGALNSVVGALAEGEAEKSALAFQENEQKISNAGSRLDLAEKELDSQKGLRKTLAANSNFFAAAGVNASQGSAAQLTEAAFGKTGAELDKIQGQRNLLELRNTNTRNSLAAKRGQAGSSANRKAFTSLIDFGSSAQTTIEKYQKKA